MITWWLVSKKDVFLFWFYSPVSGSSLVLMYWFLTAKVLESINRTVTFTTLRQQPSLTSFFSLRFTSPLRFVLSPRAALYTAGSKRQVNGCSPSSTTAKGHNYRDALSSGWYHQPSLSLGSETHGFRQDAGSLNTCSTKDCSPENEWVRTRLGLAEPTEHKSYTWAQLKWPI